MRKRLKWIFEREIIEALNENNGTDCNYEMFDIKILETNHIELGLHPKHDPTETIYCISVADLKEFKRYKMTFKYGYNSKTDYFEVLSIEKM